MYNNTLVCILLTVFGCITAFTASASKPKPVNFNEVIVKVPYNITQEIIAADILPNQGKELVIFSVDEERNRWLMIYKLDHSTNQYIEAEKVIIPSIFYRFDLSKKDKAGKQALYFLSTDALMLYQNKHFKKLAKIKSLYIQEQADFISRGDFIQDVNNDGFDDVIIADFTQTHLLIGQGIHTFARQVLPIKPIVQILSEGASYSESQLYFSDVNFDDKKDILLVGNGEMLVYLQNKQSQFSNTAVKLAINETISGTDWWDKRDESGEQLDQSNLTYRKLEELRDVNADGITDMIVSYIKSSGVFDKVNDYEIFFGKNKNGMLSYAQQADSVIHTEGTLTGLDFVDIDNDDKFEVLLAGFDIGLSQVVGALMTGGIDQDVYVFKMDKEDRFPTKPAIKKEVELTFSLSSGQSGSAIVKLADLNGDGLKELVLSDDDDELKIYLGKKITKKTKGTKSVKRQRNRSFSKRSVGYDTQLPKDGNLVIIDDLNGDGKDDLIMKFSALDGEDKAKEFKILFSQ